MVGYVKSLVTRRSLITGLTGSGLLLAGCGRTRDRGFTILGVNSFRRAPGIALPYRLGMQLAENEANARGGVSVRGGMQVHVVPVNDGGEAWRARAALRAQLDAAPAAVVAGGCFECVAKEIANVCETAQVPFISAVPMRRHVGAVKRGDFTFHLGPSATTMISMLMAGLPETPRTWAFIASQSALMQSALEATEGHLRRRNSDVEIVVDSRRDIAPDHLDDALARVRAARPEALLLALDDVEECRLARSGKLREAFLGDLVVHLPPMPEPRVLAGLVKDAHTRSIAPYYDVDERQSGPHGTFVRSFLRAFSDPPTFAALMGYITVKVAIAAAETAQGVQGQELAAALSAGLFDTPVGEMRFRASDHQSTLGAWIIEKTRGETRATYADAGPHLG